MAGALPRNPSKGRSRPLQSRVRPASSSTRPPANFRFALPPPRSRGLGVVCGIPGASRVMSVTPESGAPPGLGRCFRLTPGLRLARPADHHFALPPPRPGATLGLPLPGQFSQREAVGAIGSGIQLRGGHERRQFGLPDELRPGRRLRRWGGLVFPGRGGWKFGGRPWRGNGGKFGRDRWRSGVRLGGIWIGRVL